MPRPEGKSFAIPKQLVWEAWRRVKANKGAPGVDGQDLAEFEADLEGNLYKIWNRMSSGTWFPPPVRAVEIPKPHSPGVRVLGVPAIQWVGYEGYPNHGSPYRQRERALGGRPAKGPWPRPVRDRVAVVVHAYALKYPAWGHRKIWALTVADGHRVSMRTVHRILDERGLLNGRRYQAERRELAKARKATFHDPPTRRNRVWQTDFSELETRAGGTWQMSGVVDYVTKFCLTCPVTATKTWREAVAALEAARERAGEVLGHPLIADLVDRQTGELEPVVVVTDNGPCYKAGAFARYIRSRPEFEHVRTRHRSPETNGVIERWYQSIKYEHLYLHEIDDGPGLAEHVAGYQRIYNDERPHETIDWARPRDRYTRALA